MRIMQLKAEIDGEGTAVTGLADYVDRTVMRFSGQLHDRKAEATPSISLRAWIADAIESVENAVDGLGGNTDARI